MHLNDLKTLACGTMGLNRKNSPPISMLPKLKTTDTNTSTLTNGTLNLLRFFDKREVTILTTAYDGSMMTTGKVNPVTHEPITKLTAVAHYKFMGASTAVIRWFHIMHSEEKH